MPKQSSPPEAPPTRVEVERAINQSGYLLESRVAGVFKERGYHVIRSPHFEDPDRGVSREIDLLAYQKFTTPHVNLTLAAPVACKVGAVASLVVFSDGEGGSASDMNLADQIAGRPSQIVTEEDDEEYLLSSHWEGLALGSELHYLRRSHLCWQWAQVKWNQKRKDWWALHDEEFDDFDKLLRFVYQMRYGSASPVPEEEVPHIVLTMPIFVYCGDVYICSVADDPPTFSATQHAVLALRRASATVTGDYCIDLVAEQGLPDYLDTVIREDVQRVGKLLERNASLLAQVHETEQQYLSLRAALDEM